VTENQRGVDPRIEVPRPWWMEFILHFGTLGVYSLFWMFASARELRSLTDRRFWAWLWFVVPLFMPAQLVAIPRFIKAWDAVGQPYGLSTWSRWTIPTTIAMVLLSVAFPLHEVFPELVDPEVFLLGWLLCWAGLFTGMSARINRVKVLLPRETFSNKGRRYTVFQWVLLGCLSPITLLVIVVWVTQQLVYHDVENLPADSTYVDADGRFKFPLVGDGWRSVDVGKYSDGDATLEIEGPGSTMYFLVFEHGHGVSIDDVVSVRLAESRDELTNGTCEESRAFVPNRAVVVSYAECRGTYFWDPALQTVTVFEVDGNAYEFLGWLNVPSESFGRLSVGFRRAARGFEPL